MVRDHEHDTDGIALDERVSSLLSAAAAPSEPGPLPGEGAALAAFRAAQPQHGRSPRRPVLALARSGMAAAVAGLLLTGGVAAATAGVLPGIAQDTVDGVLVDLGVGPRADEATSTDHGTRDTGETAVPPVSSVPSGDGDAGELEDRGSGAGAEKSQQAEHAGAHHGQEVSRTARETDATGVDKGAEISALASRGTSRAGEDHRGVRHTDARAERGRRAEAAAARDTRRRLPEAATARRH